MSHNDDGIGDTDDSRPSTTYQHTSLAYQIQYRWGRTNLWTSIPTRATMLTIGLGASTMRDEGATMSG